MVLLGVEAVTSELPWVLNGHGCFRWWSDGKLCELMLKQVVVLQGWWWPAGYRNSVPAMQCLRGWLMDSWQVLSLMTRLECHILCAEGYGFPRHVNPSFPEGKEVKAVDAGACDFSKPELTLQLLDSNPSCQQLLGPNTSFFLLSLSSAGCALESMPQKGAVWFLGACWVAPGKW